MPAQTPTPVTRALLVTGVFALCAAGGALVAVPSRVGTGLSDAATHQATSDSAPATVPSGDRSTTTAASTTTSTTIDVGALPQTDDRPTTTSALFDTNARALWQAIVDDNPDLALGFFFPLSAYRQVKAISDPDGDYHNRLIANFRADVHSLHEQLGADAATAQFQGLVVPDSAAQWIEPGVEYNKGSYWRVFGSELHYLVGGVEHSLPVASLISWRGEWYVVHLGPIR